VNVEPVANACFSTEFGDLGEQPQFYFANSRGPITILWWPGVAMKARRIFWPSSLRTGMFCMFLVRTHLRWWSPPAHRMGVTGRWVCGWT